MGFVLVTLLVASLFVVGNQVVGLMRNIAKAKRSGFQYIVLPHVSMLPIYSMASVILRWLSLPKHWLYYIEPLDISLQYRIQQRRSERLDDVFLVVSPGLIVLHVANAELNHWVMSHREQFPKWRPVYAVLRVFGPNLLTTEGSEWRHHRQLTAGTFNETNAALVFRESVQQSQSMLRKWTGEVEHSAGRRGQGKVLATACEDVTKLTLHIIGYVGFGLRMLWPDETPSKETDEKLAKFSWHKAPSGYQVSFLDAIEGVLHHIIYVILFPTWFLDYLPLQGARQAGRVARDYLKYCNELLDKRLADDKENAQEKKAAGMDLMGHLVKTGRNGWGLDRSAIIGNAFVLQVAGHETTANSMYYTLVYLACFPEAQRLLQRDLDAVVGDTEPSTWEYSAVVDALLASHVGAAMHETLRLMPPVVSMPRMTVEDQAVTVDGKSYTIPKDVAVFVGAMSTGRNERYWPTRPSRYRAGETDIGDYVPERWFRESKKENARVAADGQHEAEETEEEEKEVSKAVAGLMSNENVFRPVRGSYLPFSAGARGCIGRRVAHAEFMAALAVVFREHSIELIVNEEEDSAAERSNEKALYESARRETLATLKTARITTSLKLADGQKIGLRIVKRGEERFVGWMD